MIRFRDYLCIYFGIAVFCVCLAAQDMRPLNESLATNERENPPAGGLDRRSTSKYTLGPNDQVLVFVPDLEDNFSHPVKVDLAGDINLPLVGRLHVLGLTSQELESLLNSRLSKYLNQPSAVVNVTEFGSQPVSILGEVMTPGIHQIQGNKTLFEVLSVAGGLRPDAGSVVNITRDLKWGAIPLPDVHEDASQHFSIASVKVKSILNAKNPAENIAIKPDDVIAVPKAEVVYAVGSVGRPGAFVLGENETLSALQVISLAQGLLKTAAGDKAKILRAAPNSSTRTEVVVNLKRLMAGKDADVSLKANDILFVPNSAAKSAGYRSLEAIVQAATTTAVYGRY
jgi:polysaccharide biosynthesis/export protein